jgi:hypothetical protein
MRCRYICGLGVDMRPCVTVIIVARGRYVSRSLVSWVDSYRVHSVRRPVFWLLYHPRVVDDDNDDDDDDDSKCGMSGRGNRITRRKPAPVPLCPPQIPHDPTQAQPGPPRSWHELREMRSKFSSLTPINTSLVLNCFPLEIVTCCVLKGAVFVVRAAAGTYCTTLPDMQSFLCCCSLQLLAKSTCLSVALCTMSLVTALFNKWSELTEIIATIHSIALHMHFQPA